MARTDALDAFDGVAIRLHGGRVVRVPPLTVGEAAHFTRSIAALSDEAEDRRATMETFVAEFGARMGLEDASLVELGVEMEAVSFGDLTFRDASEMLALLHTAGWSDDVFQRSRAQARWLDEAPPTFGLTSTEPGDVFGFGHEFASAFYLHVYGLAMDFCSRLARSPRVEAWAVMGQPQEPSTSSAISAT